VLLFVALWELTESLWPSAFVAALFAIHPLRVSSVAWIAERKDVLSGGFFMLTLWAYARYAKGRASSSTVALVFFAIGLMCKPTLVTLPFILLLLDYWPLRRFAPPTADNKSQRLTRSPGAVRTADHGARSTSLPVRALILEKIPFFVLSAASCFATVLAQDRSMMTIHQLSFAGRVANAALAYVIYVGQMFWPVRLAVFYPFPETTLTIAQAVLSFLALLIVAVIFFLYRAKYPFLLVGWLWFLGVLIPMIGIVQVGGQGHADRYTYLAQIGLYLLLTWSALELLARWRGGRVVLVAVAVLIISGLVVNSYSQASYWKDNETLWRQTLANTDRNYIADNGLADTLMKEGKFDEAITHFQRALQIDPESAEIQNNLGNAFLRKKNWPEAKTAYETALKYQPNLTSALNNLGICLAEMGKPDEALAEFDAALRVDPGFLDTHRNLAILFLQIGRRDEAIAHLKQALRLKPDDAQTIAQLRQLGIE
jgi:tetratricopeptide (TPR) repeat protein